MRMSVIITFILLVAGQTECTSTPMFSFPFIQYVNYEIVPTERHHRQHLLHNPTGT